MAEVATAVRRLRRLPRAEELRWIQPGTWHFTLAFYGEVEDGLLPELRERLGRAARRHRPYEMRLCGAGRFTHRALWIGAEGDRRAMARLADTASAAGRRAGLPMGGHRAYTPHLTIARSRDRTRTDLRPFVDALAGFSGAPWLAGELTLVRSLLPVSGVEGEQPQYETLQSWPLNA